MYHGLLEDPTRQGTYVLSPALLDCNHPELPEYISRTMHILQNTALGDPGVRPALEELERSISP